MLRILGSDLRPVLLEAIANGCRVALVRDHGVYLMSEKGEAYANGTRKVVAYAVGYNPEIDDDWWERSRRELGVDDFSKYFDVTNPVLVRILNSNDDLAVRARGRRLFLAIAPR